MAASDYRVPVTNAACEACGWPCGCGRASAGGILLIRPAKASRAFPPRCAPACSSACRHALFPDAPRPGRRSKPSAHSDLSEWAVIPDGAEVAPARRSRAASTSSPPTETRITAHPRRSFYETDEAEALPRSGPALALAGAGALPALRRLSRSVCCSCTRAWSTPPATASTLS